MIGHTMFPSGTQCYIYRDKNRRDRTAARAFLPRYPVPVVRTVVVLIHSNATPLFSLLFNGGTNQLLISSCGIPINKRSFFALQACYLGARSRDCCSKREKGRKPRDNRGWENTSRRFSDMTRYSFVCRPFSRISATNARKFHGHRALIGLILLLFPLPCPKHRYRGTTPPEYEERTKEGRKVRIA